MTVSYKRKQWQKEKHPTIRVEVGDMEADIDVDIADLIEQIWIAEIRTCNSCQENRPGIAWIEFLTAADAMKFLNIVAGEFSEEVESRYNRIFQTWSLPGKCDVAMWEYATRPLDISVWEDENDDGVLVETQVGPTMALFSVSIRFPISDIPDLLKRLADFNIQSDEFAVAQGNKAA